MYQPEVWSAGKNTVQGMVSHISGPVLNKMSSSSEASHEQSAMELRNKKAEEERKEYQYLPGICFKIKLCCKTHTVSTQTSNVGAYFSFLVHQNLKYSAFGLQTCICACATPSFQMFAATWFL